MTNLDSFQTVKHEDSPRPQIFVCGNEATNLLLENGFSREGAWGGGGGEVGVGGGWAHYSTECTVWPPKLPTWLYLSP